MNRLRPGESPVARAKAAYANDENVNKDALLGSPTRSLHASPSRSPLTPRTGSRLNETYPSQPPLFYKEDLSIMHSTALSHGNPAQPESTSSSQVAGLHGRRKLQRDDNESKPTRNWMDSQRMDLQAYEYLCHVGEAKEWLEAVIGEEIAPVVELEEALRDGVVLAKVTRVFEPTLVRRIFESPRLQFRHSENINYFFSFLDHIGMPELFTFELTDLYDKKNIPKVIYCIHALSFILASEQLAQPVGDLVGKLDFTDDEIRTTQRGLNAQGVSLPNFKGMGKQFGIMLEPEPEPLSDEQLMAMALRDAEPNILEFQALFRGALFRAAYEADRAQLSSCGPDIVRLQAALRGNELRSKMKQNRAIQTAHEAVWVRLQAVIRARMLRGKMEAVLGQIFEPSSDWAQLQAAARGSQLRHELGVLHALLRDCVSDVVALQSIFRAKQCRAQIHRIRVRLTAEEPAVLTLQSLIRAAKPRRQLNRNQAQMLGSESWVKQLQSRIRGQSLRQNLSDIRIRIKANDSDMVKLQSIARAHLVRTDVADVERFLHRQELAIVQLQSIIRAGRVRARAAKTLDNLDLVTSSIVRIQAIYRGCLARFGYGLLLEELDDELEAIVGLQSAVRGYLVRKSFTERQRHFKTHLDQVIKIQSFVRAKRQGDAYKSLTAGSNPPLSVVKSFVHLLNDSDLDFDQEVHLEQQRKRVIDGVRHNELLEQYITQLDVKIALLLKNKITLDELVKHRNKGLPTTQRAGDAFDLKALTKTARRRLELYQGLFYILQTQPAYFSRLFRQLKENVLSEKNAQDLESLVMTVYGYGQKRREEFFLLGLIARSIREELQGSASVRAFLRGTFVWLKLFHALNRQVKDQAVLKDVLGSTVGAITDQVGLDLESDPLAIYRASINNEELRTGVLSTRPPDVTVDQAICDPETRTQFVANLQQLRELSNGLLTQIEQCVELLPFRIRYLAFVVHESAKRQFSDESEDRLLSLIGHIVVTNYLAPALLAADNYGITSVSLGAQHLRNLKEVARMLGQLAQLKPFSRDNVFLQPLNDYITENIPRMRALYKHLVAVPDLETEFEMTMFDDLTSHRRPSLYIKSTDIFALHSLISAEIAVVAPDSHDSLRSVLKELGTLPNDAKELLNIAQFVEVKLDLNPSFCRVEDPEAEVNSLFVAVKRCLVYVLRVQSGADLMDVLLTPVGPEHEDKYRAILREEKLERGKRAAKDGAIAYQDPVADNALGDLSKVSYRELKLLTLEKVIELESCGRISRDENYQEILNSIAVDIKTKKNRRESRRKELASVNQTLVSLATKEAYLQTQLKTYNDYIEQAMATLQTKKGARTKRLVLPFTRQYFHQRDLLKSGRMPQFGSYNYSATNLFEKRILVELDGYAERQYSQVSITFASDQVGVFTIEAAYGGVTLPGAVTQITLDELLGQQYNNHQYFALFDGMIKFNTNLLLHFIFKKFYGEA